MPRLRPRQRPLASTPDNKENNTLKRQREPSRRPATIAAMELSNNTHLRMSSPNTSITRILRMKRRLAVPRTSVDLHWSKARTRTQRKMSERASQRGLTCNRSVHSNGIERREKASSLSLTVTLYAQGTMPYIERCCIYGQTQQIKFDT